jgi:hypothetical protein
MRARWLLSALVLAAARAAAADPEPVPAAPEAPAAEPAAGAPDPRELLRRAEWVLRGDGNALEATLTVSRDGRKPRVLPFRVGDDRLGDRVRVRILPPATSAGSTLLKLPPVLWSFEPKDRVTRRIPRPAWMEAWMGSEFTLDDLVHGSGLDDYQQRLLGVAESAGPDGGARAWVVESTPRVLPPVAWGRLVDWVDREHSTLLRREFYDASGALVRTLVLEDLREVAGRRFPHLWVMRSAQDPARESRIHVDSVRFGPDFEASTFAPSQLRPAD